MCTGIRSVVNRPSYVGAKYDHKRNMVEQIHEMPLQRAFHPSFCGSCRLGSDSSHGHLATGRAGIPNLCAILYIDRQRTLVHAIYILRYRIRDTK